MYSIGVSVDMPPAAQYKSLRRELNFYRDRIIDVLFQAPVAVALVSISMGWLVWIAPLIWLARFAYFTCRYLISRHRLRDPWLVLCAMGEDA